MYYHPSMQRDFDAAQERAQYLVERVAEQIEEEVERVYDDLLALPVGDVLKVLADDIRQQVENALDATARSIAGLS